MRSSGSIKVIKTSKLGAITGFAFILFSVIEMEVAKTKSSFLEVLGKSSNNSFFVTIILCGLTYITCRPI